MRKRETALLPIMALLAAILLTGCISAGNSRTEVTIRPLESGAPALPQSTDGSPAAEVEPEDVTPAPEAEQADTTPVPEVEQADTTPVPEVEKPAEDGGDPEPEKRRAANTEIAPLPTEWYGWWCMPKTEGQWKDMYGYWWDCCAVLEELGDGSLQLEIWDEDLPRDVGLAYLLLTPTRDGHFSVAGSMMDAPVAIPGGDGVSVTNGELVIVGGYLDEEEGSFLFKMRLKPWGQLWEVDKDELPYYYKSWYLPLINADMPMPDVIGE